MPPKLANLISGLISVAENAVMCDVILWCVGDVFLISCFLSAPVEVSSEGYGRRGPSGHLGDGQMEAGVPS